jgi:hypothetical protein
MSRFITVVALLFAPTVWAQAPPQHQHATTESNMVDGSVHPELIPDSVAYRLYLLTVSLPLNPTDQDRKFQQAHLAKTNLGQNDIQNLQIVLAEFRSEFEAWKNRFDAAATKQGSQFDPTPFLQQRDDITQNTRTALAQSLSSDGLIRLNNHIQSEKKNMRVAAN